MRKQLVIALLLLGFVYAKGISVYSDSIRIFKDADDTYWMAIYGIVTSAPGTVVDSVKTITADSIIVTLCFDGGSSNGDILHINDTIYLGSLSNSVYGVSLHMAIATFVFDDCITTHWKGTNTFSYDITGIDELSRKTFLSPNPATSSITIQSENNLPAQTSFQLFDVTGRMILQKQINDKSTRIDLNEVCKGMYLYHLSASGQKISSGKIVVE